MAAKGAQAAGQTLGRRIAHGLLGKIYLSMRPPAPARGAKIRNQEMGLRDDFDELVAHGAKDINAWGHANGACTVEGATAPIFTPGDLAHECAAGALLVRERMPLSTFETKTNNTNIKHNARKRTQAITTSRGDIDQMGPNLEG